MERINTILEGTLGLIKKHLLFSFGAVFILGSVIGFYASETNFEDAKYLIIEDHYNRMHNKDLIISAQHKEINGLNKLLNDSDWSNSELYYKAVARQDIIETQDAIIQEFARREELFDKSEIAVMNTYNERTDMTYDQLEYLKSLCDEKGIPYRLMTYMIKLESNYNPSLQSTQSSARGYMQVIRDTGRYTYEEVMGNPKGSYNHSMALDPYNNLLLSTSYIDYLFDRSNGSVDEMIKRYSGFYSPHGIGYKYFELLDKHMTKFGYSVNTAQQEYDRMN